MHIERSKWSGEGAFTQALLDVLERMEEIEFLRVEDAPATRSDADYNFISNEIYVAFVTRPRALPDRRFKIFPTTRTILEQAFSLAQLEERLSATPAVGPADYSDEGMIQYLRSERIVPPYQTRGYKLVELIRIYDAGSSRRP